MISKTNLNQKGFSSLIKIIVILLLLFIVMASGLAAIYYYSKSKEKSKKVTTSERLTKDFRLVKFPNDKADLQENDGIPTVIFSKNEKIGVEGTLKTTAPKSVTYQILDYRGREIRRGQLELKIRSNAAVRMCCIIPPQKTGRYALEFFLNGEEASIFPLLFTVSP